MTVTSSIITKVTPWCLSIPAAVRAVSQSGLSLRVNFGDFRWASEESDWRFLLPEGHDFTVILDGLDINCTLDQLAFDSQGVDLNLTPDQKTSYFSHYAE